MRVVTRDANRHCHQSQGDFTKSVWGGSHSLLFDRVSTFTETDAGIYSLVCVSGECDVQIIFNYSMVLQFFCKYKQVYEQFKCSLLDIVVYMLNKC